MSKNRNIKNEIQQKVETLRSQQKTWLKQRSEEKQQSQAAVSTTGSHTHKKRAIITPRIADSTQYTKSTPVPLTPPTGTNRPISGFQAWLDAHQQRRPSTQGDAPLSDEEFVDLANHVVSRVHRDIKVERQTQSDHVTSPPLRDHVNQSQQLYGARDTHDSNVTMVIDASRPISHYCIQCRELMVLSGCDPMMFVPCGHTVCTACSCVSSCPQCQCHVASLTPNITLKHIIQGLPTSTAAVMPDDKGAHNRAVATTHNVQVREHKEDLQTLEFRCEMLEQEQCNIDEERRKVEEKIGRELEAIDYVTQQEDQLKRQIQSIEKELVQWQHKRSCHLSRIDELREDKNKQNKKNDLIQSTIDTIRNEIAKVRVQLDTID